MWESEAVKSGIRKAPSAVTRPIDGNDARGEADPGPWRRLSSKTSAEWPEAADCDESVATKGHFLRVASHNSSVRLRQSFATEEEVSHVFACGGTPAR